MSSDKSYKAPLEFEDEECVADDDASSLVSFEEHDPSEIVEASMTEDANDDDDDDAASTLIQQFS